MRISNTMGLDKYGITFMRDTIFKGRNVNSKLILETPIQFRGGVIEADKIGAFTYLGNERSLFKHIGEIGRFCAIASDVQTGHSEHSTTMLSPHPLFIGRFDNNWKSAECLYDDMDCIEKLRKESEKSIKRSGLITIGNDVWIGSGVYISRGVKIGDGAIIAARSVVVKDVAPYTIVAGVPAKIIRLRFEENQVEKLLKLQWWKYGPQILKGLQINDIKSTISYIEERIISGMPFYNCDEIIFDIKEKTIYKQKQGSIENICIKLNNI